jgi:hypothetical protein
LIPDRDKYPQRIVADAEWQAGLTRGNVTKRPYLNGEPMVSAFAASYIGGWVAFWNAESLIGYTKQRGYVEIRDCPGERA